MDDVAKRMKSLEDAEAGRKARNDRIVRIVGGIIIVIIILLIYGGFPPGP